MRGSFQSRLHWCWWVLVWLDDNLQNIKTTKHWNAKMPKCWNTEIPKHRSTETSKHQNIETPQHRNTQAPKYQCTETPKLQNIIKLKHQTDETRKHLNTITPNQWNIMNIKTPKHLEHRMAAKKVETFFSWTQPSFEDFHGRRNKKKLEKVSSPGKSSSSEKSQPIKRWTLICKKLLILAAKGQRPVVLKRIILQK